jgi:hypothetical protein
MFGRTSVKQLEVINTLATQLAVANDRLKNDERIITALEASMDWFRARLTQLEHERALLIQHYMGITIKVPEITLVKPDAPTSPREQTPFLDLASAALFADVGEEEATRLGITHNADGTLKYRE